MNNTLTKSDLENFYEGNYTAPLSREESLVFSTKYVGGIFTRYDGGTWGQGLGLFLAEKGAHFTYTLPTLVDIRKGAKIVAYRDMDAFGRAKFYVLGSGYKKDIHPIQCFDVKGWQEASQSADGRPPFFHGVEKVIVLEPETDSWCLATVRSGIGKLVGSKHHLPRAEFDKCLETCKLVRETIWSLDSDAREVASEMILPAELPGRPGVPVPEDEAEARGNLDRFLELLLEKSTDDWRNEALTMPSGALISETVPEARPASDAATPDSQETEPKQESPTAPGPKAPAETPLPAQTIVLEKEKSPASPQVPVAADGNDASPNESEAEKQAILAFWHALETAGWKYSLRDIVRFHTSVRCNQLTLLGGSPGSGKSSLARMYARYFGLSGQDCFLSIDVQPSWHDRMDFLGFVKTHVASPEFVPAETGMSEFLDRASAAGNGLWLACLEEINLARPEHYFADFLQRVTLDEPETSPIRLGKVKEVKLSSSVRFVGTCNFDETTQNFSARFLDRCHYIELFPMPLRDLFFSQLPKDIDKKLRPDWKWKPWRPGDTPPPAESDKHKTSLEGLLGKIASSEGENLLETLHLLPSARTVKGILRYIAARLDTVAEEKAQDKKPPDDRFHRALDEAFVQRVFSKLLSSQAGFPMSDFQGGRKESLITALDELKLPLCAAFVRAHMSDV